MKRVRTAFSAAVVAAGVLLAARSTPRPAHAQEEMGAIPPNVQVAVDKGLAWLDHAQSSDGSWNSGNSSNAAAITGLSIMAFMARGHVPGQGPYGQKLNKAVDALLALQTPDGVIAGSALSQPMYDHGISTIALCEAYGMLDEPQQSRARVAISKAVRIILDAQRITKDFNSQGGWRYSPTAHDSDMSVSGWQLMALRGAKNVGAFLPPKAIEDGINYLKRQAGGDGSFAYSGGARGDMALTGTGVLCLTLMGEGSSDPVKRGGEYMLRNNIVQESNYFYTVYYCQQAAYQLGGQYWDAINKTITTDLVRKQSGNGSWSPGAGVEHQGGDAYATSMAILALTVPYHYLPIYQR